MRDTPPSIQDGPYGLEPSAVNNFENEPASRARTGISAQTAERLARESWQASTSWLNAGRRAQWNNSLRAFNNLHPSSSKYLSNAYQHRSSMYRPKTRTMVRRDEAATAAAFFSNEDVVSIAAADDNDVMQQASAEVMKALLQYRLTKTIPWFLTLVGARQDADVMGVCAAKAYWKYEERKVREETRYTIDPTTGMLATNGDGSLREDVVDIMERLDDKPVIDLIAPENIRVEPGADWRDPVNSSPYVIEAVPMYLADVQAKMDEGEWLEVPWSAISDSMELDDDTTRRGREAGRVPGKDNDSQKPRAFHTVWVHENIIRWNGEDWHFYTLRSGTLLSNPRPLDEVYLHGIRPYVLGSVVIEAHKTFPSGKVELVRDLQWAANDDWNLRFDVLKMSLHPRQFVKQGQSVDLGDLRSFIPGKTVLLKDPQTDVVWDRPPPPGAEAYAEQDRINLDFDDITGAFSNSSVQSSQIQQQSATGMHLMSGEASGVAEYELRVFAETFVEKLIYQLIKLEQAYETDPVILTLAGKKAQLMARFGINAITDELLAQDLILKVNVGIGATNPAMKLRNMMMATEMLGKAFGPALGLGLNFEEVNKEIFALAGYKDGARFYKPGFDPVQAMQQMQQKNAKAPAGPHSDPQKLQEIQLQSQAKLQEIAAKREADRELAMIDLQAQRENDQNENARAQLSDQRSLQTEQMKATVAVAGHMAKMPPPGGDLTAGMPQPDMQPPAPAVPVGPHPNEAALHQVVGSMQQNLGGLAEAFAQAMQQMAQVVAQNGQQTAQAVAQLAQMMQQEQGQTEQILAQMAAQSDQRMQSLSASVTDGHKQIASAMSRPRKVVRGADGRVEGVE